MRTTHLRLALASSAAALLLTVSTTIAEPFDSLRSLRVEQAPAQTNTATPDRSGIYRDVYQGWKWWHVYCYRCHGVDALGTTTAPNLTDPNEKFTRAEFLRVVRAGVPKTAMQAWNKLLDDQQIGQLYVYVRARADKVLPSGRPDEVGPNGGPWVPPQGWRAR
jgi:mono/diheme cytochrome c family protein